MQRMPMGYSEVLDRLLRQLENMPVDRAARHAEFLAQHLADLRRPAPHLYRPSLLERQARLEALLSVFMDQRVDAREEEQQWCRDEWVGVRPFLETMGEGEDESQEEEGHGLTETRDPAPEHQIVAIEDSQEAVEEGGSQVQVARLADGSVRDMSMEENEMLQWAEAVEAEAAEDERRREQERWNEFASTAYSSWGQWSVANQDVEPGVKRARVQIRTQGEGGRIVRDEQYMVALRDGEQLAYQVSVRSTNVEQGDKGVYAERAEEHMASEMARSSSEGAAPHSESVQGAEEQDGRDQQGKDHIDVQEFVASPLGRKFYEEWKTGRVGPQIIGQRFGYGALGAYASMWEDEKEAQERESGCLTTTAGEAEDQGDVEPELPEHGTDHVEAEGTGETAMDGGPVHEGGDDSGVPDHRQRHREGFQLKPPPDQPVNVEESQESGGNGSDLVLVAGGHADAGHQSEQMAAAAGEAASLTPTGASVSGSSTAESSGRRVQTSLDRWLL